METSALGLVHAILGVVLLVLGALALTARKRRQSRHGAAGNLYFGFLIAVLGSGMVVGWLNHPDQVSVFQVVTPPTLALGLLGYVMVKRRPHLWLGRPWLFWHVVGQAGSFIGVVTATAFQIVPRFLPSGPILAVALFAIPSAIGSILIGRTLRRWALVGPKAPAQVKR